METIHQNYSNIPCQGRDCVFHGGDYEDVHYHEKGYSPLTRKWHDEFTVIYHGERCNIVEKIAAIRQEIYERAWKKYDEAMLSEKYKKPWKQAAKEFDRVADEWRNLKCPFYEKKEE